jgi:hypothetical protein
MNHSPAQGVEGLQRTAVQRVVNQLCGGGDTLDSDRRA